VTRPWLPVPGDPAQAGRGGEPVNPRGFAWRDLGGDPRPLAEARGQRRRAAPDSPAGAPGSRDMRCPSGSGWGEAPVTGRFRAVPASPTSRTCATPDGRRRAAKAGRPLTRETSAGGAPCFGWVAKGASALLGAFGPPGSNEARASSPGSGGLHGGWLQPHPEVFLPVQRKLGALRGRARSGDRSILWLCSWIVLVAEVDERHLVQVSHRAGQPPRGGVGSSHVPAPRVSHTGSAW
jgi:hypothetical protein